MWFYKPSSDSHHFRSVVNYVNQFQMRSSLFWFEISFRPHTTQRRKKWTATIVKVNFSWCVYYVGLIYFFILHNFFPASFFCFGDKLHFKVIKINWLEILFSAGRSLCVSVSVQLNKILSAILCEYEIFLYFVAVALAHCKWGPNGSVCFTHIDRAKYHDRRYCSMFKWVKIPLHDWKHN